MEPVFITGIGTGVGKTLVAAIVTEALQAGYWKPVQAGYSDGTDSEWVSRVISHPLERIYPETYRFSLPASPHIAARQEATVISVEAIARQLHEIQEDSRTPLNTFRKRLVIEGAGGLLVPLNEKEFVLDLVKKLDIPVILVSRNYLGSINHSLLTAAVCKMNNLKVAGWIFNDQYGQYEEEIMRWSGLPLIASIPYTESPGREFVRTQAHRIRASLQTALSIEPENHD
jgi:dethiobiotin synthetase